MFFSHEAHLKKHGEQVTVWCAISADSIGTYFCENDESKPSPTDPKGFQNK